MISNNYSFPEKDNSLDTRDDFGSKIYWQPYRALINCLSGVNFAVLYPETNKEKVRTGSVIMQWKEHTMEVVYYCCCHQD